MFNYEPSKGQINNSPSETVPDQTMSIREILVRYARGLPITGGKPHYYDEEQYTPDIKTMDLADLQELHETTRQEVQNLRSQLDDLSKKKQKAAAEKAIKEAKEQLKKELEAGGSQFQNVHQGT